MCPTAHGARPVSQPGARTVITEQASHRTIPLVVSDCANIRDHQDEALAGVLVARVKPSNVMMATVCGEKGFDIQIVSRLARFIKDIGYAHLAYRSDQEARLRAIFGEAFTKSKRQRELYNPRIQQIVPEASSVG